MARRIVSPAGFFHYNKRRVVIPTSELMRCSWTLGSKSHDVYWINIYSLKLLAPGVLQLLWPGRVESAETLSGLGFFVSCEDARDGGMGYSIPLTEVMGGLDSTLDRLVANKWYDRSIEDCFWDLRVLHGDAYDLSPVSWRDQRPKKEDV